MKQTSLTSDWSPDEVLYLRRKYGSTPDAKLARRLGRSQAAIARKAKALALSKNKAAFKGATMPRWTKEQIATLVRMHPSESNRAIALHLGRSEKSVSSMAAKMGLKKDARRLAQMGIENVALRRRRR